MSVSELRGQEGTTNAALERFIDRIYSRDKIIQHDGVIGLRKLLASQNEGRHSIFLYRFLYTFFQDFILSLIRSNKRSH